MNLTDKELFSNNLNKVETRKTISDISYAFQESVFDVLYSKTTNAAKEFSCNNILISGGVAANGFLRENFSSQSSFKIIFPEKQLCTDNGIMIASRGLIDYLKNKKLDENLDVTPQLNIL
jgi:N6-L-threonylcarbamoyladenine synthase